MRSRFVAVVCALVLVAGLAAVSYRLGEGSGAEESGAAVLTEPPDDPGSGQPRDDDGDAAAAPAELPDDFSAIAELYERITSEAVEAPGDEELLEGAIEGMLGTLDDPYAVYYDSEEFADFNEMLDGTFSGVGLMLEETPEGAEVVSVLPDGPAEEAGVEPGERIVGVDGRDVSDAPLESIVDLVQGEEGTEVTVGFEGGSEGPRELTMTRATIDFPHVEAERLDDGAGYVRLMHFSGNAAERLREAVGDLLDDGATGIVLDLRGNPGGLLREAVAVTSVFVPDGPVVGVKERGEERQTLTATGGALDDVPLVVLVDNRSASAAEIVAGALQDRDRAPIVGTPTFGKGTVQTVRTLGDGSGVKFTTAEYFTPSGDSIEEVGVVPDERVEGEEEQLTAAQEALRSLVASG